MLELMGVSEKSAETLAGALKVTSDTCGKRMTSTACAAPVDTAALVSAMASAAKEANGTDSTPRSAAPSIGVSLTLLAGAVLAAIFA